jgi:cell cycle checkpoint control protein RAD9A
MHALFVKESANNSWSISSKTLREFVEHFGPGTEQLDIYSEDGRVSFTSYTEKIMSGNGLFNVPQISCMLIKLRNIEATTPYYNRRGYT